MVSECVEFERNTDDRRESEARPPKGAGSRRGLGQSPKIFFAFLQLEPDVSQTHALAWFLLPAPSFRLAIGLVTRDRESLRHTL